MSKAEPGAGKMDFPGRDASKSRSVEERDDWCEIETLSSSGIFQGRCGAPKADLVGILEGSIGQA